MKGIPTTPESEARVQQMSPINLLLEATDRPTPTLDGDELVIRLGTTEFAPAVLTLNVETTEEAEAAAKLFEDLAQAVKVTLAARRAV